MMQEQDPRVNQSVESTWKLYVEKPGRTVKEVFDLAIKPEVRSEFQQQAIRALLDSGVTSVREDKYQQIASRESDSHYRESEEGVRWAQQLEGSQALYT